MLRSLSNCLLIVLLAVIWIPVRADIYDIEGQSAQEVCQYIIDKTISYDQKPDSLKLALNELEANLNLWSRQYDFADEYYRLEFIKLYHFGKYHLHYGEKEKSKAYLERAYEIAFLHDHNAYLRSSSFELASYYYYEGYYLMSKIKYEESLDHTDVESEPTTAYKIIHNLAIICKYTQQYQESLKYFKQAIDIKRKLNQEKTLGMLYNNIGSAYNEIGKQDSALAYYQLAERLLEENGTDKERAINYNNLGNYYMVGGEFSQAAGYFERSLILKEKETYSYLTTFINLAILEYNQEHFPKALEMISEARELAEKYGYTTKYLEVLKFYKDYYQKEGNYQLAEQYLTEYYRLSDELQEEETSFYHEDLKNYLLLKQKIRNREARETADALSKTRLRLNKWISILIILVVIALILTTIFVIMRRFQRHEQITTLITQREILNSQKSKNLVVINMLEKLKIQLENQIENEITRLRERDLMLMIQSRNSSLGEMIGNIAHQWRQPLNAIGILIQDFAEANEFGELDEDYFDSKIPKIYKLISYLDTTLDDFKKLFDPEREMHSFSLSSVINKSIEFVSCSFTSRNIEYQIDIIHDFRLYGSENELFQAFINIFNNSKDAFQTQNLKTQLIKLKVDKEGDFGKVTISDNAGGIDEKILDSIFEPYISTHHDTTGTGIGLYIVKNIVTEHFRGKIEAQNTETGACFMITFPLDSSTD